MNKAQHDSCVANLLLPCEQQINREEFADLCNAISLKFDKAEEVHLFPCTVNSETSLFLKLREETLCLLFILICEGLFYFQFPHKLVVFWESIRRLLI